MILHTSTVYDIFNYINQIQTGHLSVRKVLRNLPGAFYLKILSGFAGNNPLSIDTGLNKDSAVLSDLMRFFVR